MIPNLTNKDLNFLSNEDLINILQSLLIEIDLVASIGAHRSTTYLAVSAIEGLFNEIFRLKKILPDTPNMPKGWPKNNQGNIPLKEVKLPKKVDLLRDEGALPEDFERLFKPLIPFRNYMHPDRELIDQTPIAQSIGQQALMCLNMLTEMYKALRFIAGHEWELICGIAKVPAENVIQMPAIGFDPVSLLVIKKAAESFREITFRVIIPPGAIFNFIYNYVSETSFMGARIEGRPTQDGKGLDNGRLVCTGKRIWSIYGKYTKETEPDARKQVHKVRIIFSYPNAFNIIVDDKQLILDGEVSWDFDSQEKIGFATEHGAISIADVEILSR